MARAASSPHKGTLKKTAARWSRAAVFIWSVRRGSPRPRLAFFFDDLDHMRDRIHHTAHGRSVFQFTGFVHFVQTQTDQCRALFRGSTDGGADLFDDNCFCPGSQASSVAALAAGASSRLGRMSATFLPRRCATPRGDCSLRRPSMVARIML